MAVLRGPPPLEVSRSKCLHSLLLSARRSLPNHVIQPLFKETNNNASTTVHKDQFPVSGILQAGGILDNKGLLGRNYLLNFRVTYSLTNNIISARSENSAGWKSALRANTCIPARGKVARKNINMVSTILPFL